jgi:uncharacterized protein
MLFSMLMRITVHDNATDFLAVARSKIEEHESANGVMLGATLRLAQSGAPLDQQPYLATVTDSGQLQLAAVMTPPHNILLFAPTEKDTSVSLSLLCENLNSRDVKVPGVLGPVNLTSLFADVWTKITHTIATKKTSQRIYDLRKINTNVIRAIGRFRLAEPRDIDILASWHGEGLRTFLQQSIRTHEVGLWEDAKPVSVAARTRTTTNGGAINLVYTPPELRCHGYATSCVASLCQYLLNTGWKFCCLHADLTNATSNSIYQQIGFTPVCDFQEYEFSK